MDQELDYALFGKRGGSRRKALHITQRALASMLDCTPTHISTDVALRYREVAEQVNEEAYKAVIHRLSALETAIERLDFYLGQLDKAQVEVLRGYYFERRTWREMQEGTELAVKTLRKMRDTAVASLTEQYALLFSLSVITEGEKELFT